MDIGWLILKQLSAHAVRQTKVWEGISEPKLAAHNADMLYAKAAFKESFRIGGERPIDYLLRKLSNF